MEQPFQKGARDGGLQAPVRSTRVRVAQGLSRSAGSKAPQTLPDTHLIAHENVRSARAAKMRGECPLLLPPPFGTRATGARTWIEFRVRQRVRDAVREHPHCAVHVPSFMRAVCDLPACSCPDPGSGAWQLSPRDPFAFLHLFDLNPSGFVRGNLRVGL